MLAAFQTVILEDMLGQPTGGSFDINRVCAQYPHFFSGLGSANGVGLRDLIRVVDDGGEIREPVYNDSYSDDSGSDHDLQSPGRSKDADAITLKKKNIVHRHIRVSRAMPVQSRTTVACLTAALVHAAVLRDNKYFSAEDLEREISTEDALAMHCTPSTGSVIRARQSAVLKILLATARLDADEPAHDAAKRLSSMQCSSFPDGTTRLQQLLHDPLAALESIASKNNEATQRDAVFVTSAFHVTPVVVAENLFSRRWTDPLSTDAASVFVECEYRRVEPFLSAYLYHRIVVPMSNFVDTAVKRNVTSLSSQQQQQMLSGLSSLLDRVAAVTEAYRWRIVDAFVQRKLCGNDTEKGGIPYLQSLRLQLARRLWKVSERYVLLHTGGEDAACLILGSLKDILCGTVMSLCDDPQAQPTGIPPSKAILRQFIEAAAAAPWLLHFPSAEIAVDQLFAVSAASLDSAATTEIATSASVRVSGVLLLLLYWDIVLTEAESQRQGCL